MRRWRWRLAAWLVGEAIMRKPGEGVHVVIQDGPALTIVKADRFRMKSSRRLSRRVFGAGRAAEYRPAEDLRPVTRFVGTVANGG